MKVLIKEVGILEILVNDCQVEEDRAVKPSLFTYLLYQLFIEPIACTRNCCRHWGYSSKYARERAYFQGADMTKEEDKFLNKMEIKRSGNRNRSGNFGKMLISVISSAGDWKLLPDFI